MGGVLGVVSSPAIIEWGLGFSCGWVAMQIINDRATLGTLVSEQDRSVSCNVADSFKQQLPSATVERIWSVHSTTMLVNKHSTLLWQNTFTNQIKPYLLNMALLSTSLGYIHV